MRLVSVPESVLVDLIWNAELLSAGMSNDAVERQTTILRSYIREEAFYPHSRGRSRSAGKVIDLSTGKPR